MPSIWFVLFIASSLELCTVTGIVKIGLLIPTTTPSIGLPSNDTIFTAFDQALRNVSSVLHFQVSQDTKCSEATALNEAFKIKDNVDVLFGPICENAIRSIAMMADIWNQSVVTWTPIKEELESYPTLIGTLGTYEEIARNIATLLSCHGWKSIGIIHGNNEINKQMAITTKSMLRDNDVTVKRVLSTNMTGNSMKTALSSMKSSARIIVVFVPEMFLESFLFEVSAEGMNDGSYIFINWKFSPALNHSSSLSVPHPKNTLQSLLQIGPFTTSESAYTSFTNHLSNLQPASEFYAYLYDAVMLYSQYVQQYPSSLTSHLQRNLQKISYTGWTGHIQFNNSKSAIRTYRVSHYQQGNFSIVYNLSGEQCFSTHTPMEWIGTGPPLDTPKCGFTGKTCNDEAESTDTGAIIAGACIGGLVSIAALILAFILYRKMRFEKELMGMLWKVNENEIKLRNKHPTPKQQEGPHPTKKLVRMETRGTLGFGSSCSLDKNFLFAPIGNYKGSVVAVKSLQRRSIRLTREVLRDLKTLRELHHDNLNQFVGANLEPENCYVLTMYCAKGSLQDIIENDDIKLDWMFKMSFALDLARGMEFLQKSSLKSHGNLKSSNCVIDSRWVLKLTDYGAITTHPEEPTQEIGEHEFYTGLFWTAPELLRLQKMPRKGTQKGDVYSFGIILQEIFLRAAPYYFNIVSSPKEIIMRVRNHEVPPYRPHIPEDSNVPDKAIFLMRCCWHEHSESRPDFHNIRKRLVDINSGRKINIMDNMIQMLEAYSNNLEQLVTERTEELALEKQKTDRLLYNMLPPLVAEQLKRGESVQPECFDDVSIFFSDIVGFTTIANQSQPLQVVDLLNDLYTTFDEIIARHDVYKVETIGDAYMCVSGLPRRNGKKHCGEIANMALDLLNGVTNFKIRHLPGSKLQLRIGLHTGGCAAGVVGTAMPRYCLFGDTVNMASRMESTGKALHIHISAAMNSALQELGWGFMTMERGIIDVKGKGLQKTYWLIGKTGYTKPLPQTMMNLQEKWRQSQDTGRPCSPTESHISDRDHSDSMYGRAFRKTSIAISFLHSLSRDAHTPDSHSVSELSVQDLHLSCESLKDKKSPSPVTLSPVQRSQSMGENKLTRPVINQLMKNKKSRPELKSKLSTDSSSDESKDSDQSITSKGNSKKFSIPKIEIS
ncbi:atrial natriuretic peptide receptor 2-like [Saccostrea echinata]|uniref:atrial natriuretic peptide receptor 2-like n=1 Tax=Saccostrea echinata TaxID=191078 RepID=UPI002A81ECD0|nr:atrial natriuretic peptide receptor 2-like [Saccostrea echinata]